MGKTANTRETTMTKGRFMRVLSRSLVVLAYALVFVVALAGAILTHLDLPCARRVASRALSDGLAPIFKGKIILEDVSDLRTRGIRGADARIDAPDGTHVIVARGVRARVNPMALVRTLLAKNGDLKIGIFDVDIDSVEVNLDTDETGTPKIARTFELMKPAENKPQTGPSRGLDLDIPNIAIEHAWVHGVIKGAPQIDADADHIAAHVEVTNKVMVDVSHADIASRGMVRGANAVGSATYHLSVSETEPLVMRGAFHGEVGAIPLDAKAVTDLDTLDASVDVPEIDAEKIRALAPEAQLKGRVRAHAEAHGPFSELAVSAHANVGLGEIDVAGHVTLTEKLRADAHASVKNVDLRAIANDAPASKLALDATATCVENAEGLFAGNFTVDAKPGMVADQKTPHASFQGHFQQKNATPLTVAGIQITTQGKVDEEGAPLEISAEMHPGKHFALIDAEVHGAISDLANVRRVPGLGHGAANLLVRGEITLAPTPKLDATAVVTSAAFSHDVAGADDVKISAHASGTFTDPATEATITATTAHAAGHEFRNVVIAVAGTLSKEQVSVELEGVDTPSLATRATIGFSTATSTLTASDVDATIARGKTEIVARLATLRIAKSQIDVEGLEIRGAGDSLIASLHERPDELIVHADSNGLELAPLASLFKIDLVKGGNAKIAVDIRARREGADGQAKIVLTDGAIGEVKDVNANIEAVFAGRKTEGTIHAEIEDVGELNAPKFSVEIGGKGALDAKSWERAWGKMAFDGHVDLAKAKELLPKATRDLADVSGSLTFQGHVARDTESDDTPEVRLSLATHALHLAKKTTSTEEAKTKVVGPTEWQINGVNAELDATANGATGFAEASVRITDARGPLVSLNAKTAALPYSAIFAGENNVAAKLMTTQFSALVYTPTRKLEALPDFCKLPGATGDVTASITIDGTVEKPNIKLTASGRTLRMQDAEITIPLDIDITGTYDGNAGDVSLAVASPHEVFLHATAHANAPMRALLAGKDDWDASVKTDLTRFPLAAVTTLADRDVRGDVSGSISIADLHKDARVDANVAFEKLRVGKAKFATANVTAKYDGNALAAHVRLDEKDGFADATTNIALLWGKNLRPALDPRGAKSASLSAKNFRAAVLEPFLANGVDELDGAIDADAKISLAEGQKPELSGEVNFHDGRVDIAAIGEEFHGVNVKATFSPDGTVKVENAVAYGTTGKVSAAAAARLDGLSFVGANATLQIDKKEALALTVGGANVGKLYGRVEIGARADATSMTIDVTVPDLHVELPDVSTRSVEGLDPPSESLHVGTYSPSGSFVVLTSAPVNADKTPQKASSLTINIHLKNVEVKRGTDVTVTIEGDLVLKIADKLSLTGQLKVKSGKLAVQGKTFEIGKGTITFTGDPSNPDINLTASWKAEDGTEVFADYLGPLKTGKVNLRSEPSRPQNEIIALILFGSADGSQATPYATPQPDAQTRAGTAVGGFAAGGLNKGLDKLTGVDITTKIDTSQTNPRPEVEVQIARDITLELAFVLGTPPPGTNPDTTYATIDWRFARNWSLATTVGNLGSAIADVVWRYRY